MQYCYRKCELSNWPYTCTVDDNKPFVLNNEIRKQNTFNLIVAIIRFHTKSFSKKKVIQLIS